jgi:hypothetical protein
VTREAGYGLAVAPSPIAKKLHIKPGHRVLVLNAPAGFVERLSPLPDGADLVADGAGGGADDVQCVQVFAADSGELATLLPLASERVAYDGLLWVAYRKGGSKAGTDLNRDILAGLLRERGLEGVSLVSLDETWSSMRVRPAERVGK